MLCISAFTFLQTRFVFLSGVCTVGSAGVMLLQSSYLLTPVAQMWESSSKTPHGNTGGHAEKAKSCLAGKASRVVTLETSKAFSTAALHKSNVLPRRCSWSACTGERAPRFVEFFVLTSLPGIPWQHAQAAWFPAPMLLTSITCRPTRWFCC